MMTYNYSPRLETCFTELKHIQDAIQLLESQTDSKYSSAIGHLHARSIMYLHSYVEDSAKEIAQETLQTYEAEYSLLLAKMKRDWEKEPFSLEPSRLGNFLSISPDWKERFNQNKSEIDFKHIIVPFVKERNKLAHTKNSSTTTTINSLINTTFPECSKFIEVFENSLVKRG